jgi:hypothetical protein
MAFSPILCPLQVLSRLGVYRTSPSTRQVSGGRALESRIEPLVSVDWGCGESTAYAVQAVSQLYQVAFLPGLERGSGFDEGFELGHQLWVTPSLAHFIPHDFEGLGDGESGFIGPLIDERIVDINDLKNLHQ